MNLQSACLSIPGAMVIPQCLVGSKHINSRFYCSVPLNNSWDGCSRLLCLGKKKKRLVHFHSFACEIALSYL